MGSGFEALLALNVALLGQFPRVLPHTDAPIVTCPTRVLGPFLDVRGLPTNLDGF